MGKSSKGFGDLLKQERRKAKNLTRPVPKFIFLPAGDSRFSGERKAG